MKIKWLGHSSFLITSDAGTRIITDPYGKDDRLHYDEIKESADIVAVSHDHFDHGNVAAVGGNPEIVRGTTEAKGIKFKGIPTYHDDAEGSKRGNNTILCFDVDGVKVCHIGDLGHPLSEEQLNEVGKIDVLLIPVGGNFTIDAVAASKLCDQLNPGVIIPMHFKNDRCNFPITGVDEFLKGKSNVSRLDANEVEFQAGKLPANTQITVLKPAL